MGMNMTEKILAKHAGLASVEPGQLITCKLDMVLANDITAPPAIKEFEKIGRPVFDNTKIALVPDHFTPNKDMKTAGLTKAVRDFANANNIVNYFEVGHDAGIEHVILPEKGLVGPGKLTIGADSHTCTYGAVNGFATGVGTTDLAVALATGEAWFKVPQSIKVNLTGKKPKNINGKDVILTLIGMIGVDGALYQSLEFAGPGVAELSMTDRFTIANMAIEAGGKNGIFPFDEKTKEYVEGRVKDYEPVAPDADAKYVRTVEINLSELKPVVAFPHLPGNTKRVEDIGEIKIHQVVIGSCTNGRLEDLAIAAEIMKGHKVHKDVRCIVIPGSQQVYMEALEAGYLKTFIESGAAVSTPTCGPCMGGHMGIMTAGERCVSTTNRNFRGRMGHVDSEVYLAGPHVAAASAILGRIATPEEVE
ncbi:3-isopropylmalate dehydratase large subunit [Schwartzia succinivorans]|jgi:3-isopropylmalate/(R)-2-methylmalate dehydratase large subunit|uniref:3-isopropylmalate dehydratase large subunit n=1 Tax=Schwartzia succinivorans DSM 10502 TaxID=1123243 RepID=A0A1M4UAQ7_9FIRM|nr:3-isopropylmalate dehydratase large subunit [Schwartzia succinivorans]MBQ1918197.1 3-isopropylmalate dehydratase large subunit [Schwartzia sp. (in: firmicutes)]MBQ3862458.1 3-isopropylmalate dehydratase large subunit [Schwartzia sp. (in: firmicutes)]MBQ4152398.1 3-isopropylmalate dehydratase large subunit [Schwartzia sp. (in: firmicutes)]MBQ5413042.1 3-isopropylmalate dehydratase large subunit [Schwartzia sp. (in: firmicutes)]SHE53687.1 3-isopropylmalate/(R)-2-methylmalate dehydratase large